MTILGVGDPPYPRTRLRANDRLGQLHGPAKTYRGIDDISARVYYRPSYLFLPAS
jgi:hypothetical protein